MNERTMIERQEQQELQYQFDINRSNMVQERESLLAEIHDARARIQHLTAASSTGQSHQTDQDRQQRGIF